MFLCGFCLDRPATLICEKVIKEVKYFERAHGAEAFLVTQLVQLQGITTVLSVKQLF